VSTPPAATEPPRGPWRRFVLAHLHDYNPPATRFWLLLAAAGAVAIVLAIQSVLGLPPEQQWQSLAGWALVGAAAFFTLQIPRTHHAFAVGDVFIFLVLAQLGPGPATLAAALEGLIGALRTTRRLSSRVATVAVAAAGMGIAGLLFERVEGGLTELGMPAAAAHFSALTVAALACLACTTAPMMQLLLLKRGRRLGLAEWWTGSSWVGAMYLASAGVAATLSINARQHGLSLIVVAAVVIGLTLLLLRTYFRAQAEEDRQQQARIDAAEQEAEQNQRRFHAAFSEAAIGMAIVSDEGRVLQANQALGALLARDPATLVGWQFDQLLHAGDVGLLRRHVEGVVQRREESFSMELRCLGADRRESWVSLHCSRFDDQGGAQTGLIYQLHDISSRRRAEGVLHHIAYHDSLTDLANRNCFQERLSAAVDRSALDVHSRFAVMYLDLDRFKTVNDSLGHPCGDELLKEVARRLRDCVRPNDLVARLGGDEFALLIEETPTQPEVLALGERLLASLARPMRLMGTELRPLASIGVTFSDMGYRTADEVLRDADLAMYKAKAEGKGRLACFDNSLHAQVARKLELEADLRRAIAEGGLSLAFQPLYELSPRRLAGFEALARWQHPVHGPISPAIFIALAEETGCIEAVSAWAIDEALRQLGSWRLAWPGVEDLSVSVNVSARDLAQPGLVERVRDSLRRAGMPPGALVLEVTESTLMGQLDVARAVLRELRAMGVRLAIDDFGTGYSSLAYLSTLPFDHLKIDRSFVIGLQTSPENREIVRTVVSLARSLDKRVVAEGIETQEQLEQLIALGAHVGQGYLLSRPLTAEATAAMLAARADQAVD
jgi:diguanylate cyclase (GGDEF)-like protein/PAS domain S-box-containing protein